MWGRYLCYRATDCLITTAIAITTTNSNSSKYGEEKQEEH